MRVNLSTLEEREIEEIEVCGVQGILYFRNHVGVDKVKDILLSQLSRNYSKELKCLITNAIRAVHRSGSVVRIPRNIHAYSKNKYSISYGRMMACLDELEDLGYVSLYIGGFLAIRENGDLLVNSSSVCFLDSFLDLLKEIDTTKIVEKDPAVVEIKDTSTKKLKSTQGVPGVKEIREKIEKFNNSFLSCSVTYEGKPVPGLTHKRVFLDDLENGGRWYNTVGGIQIMRSDRRSSLRIDGERLVDLDYASMHINIMYEMIAEQVKEEGGDLNEYRNPYNIDLEEIVEVDEGAVFAFCERHDLDEYAPLRNFVKKATLIRMNCDKWWHGLGVLQNELKSDMALVGTDKEYQCQYFGLKWHLQIGDLLGEIDAKHILISDKFSKELGRKLQYIDSQILLRIIEDIIGQGEILLPYHDGILIKKRLQRMGEQAMKLAWLRELGSTHFCKITSQDL